MLHMQAMIVAHSLGDTVARTFMAWADYPEPGWCNRHIATYANVAGSTLGTPASVPALLTGETCAACLHLLADDHCVITLLSRPALSV